MWACSLPGTDFGHFWANYFAFFFFQQRETKTHQNGISAFWNQRAEGSQKSGYLRFFDEKPLHSNFAEKGPKSRILTEEPPLFQPPPPWSGGLSCVWHTSPYGRTPQLHPLPSLSVLMTTTSTLARKTADGASTCILSTHPLRLQAPTQRLRRPCIVAVVGVAVVSALLAFTAEHVPSLGLYRLGGQAKEDTRSGTHPDPRLQSLAKCTAQPPLSPPFTPTPRSFVPAACIRLA